MSDVGIASNLRCHLMGLCHVFLVLMKMALDCHTIANV